jgi:hypothetical protein
LYSSQEAPAVKNKSLIETNPHLKNPAKYRKALVVNVASSTAVETGASIESIARLLAEPTKRPALKKPGRSAR